MAPPDRVPPRRSRPRRPPEKRTVCVKASYHFTSAWLEPVFHGDLQNARIGGAGDLAEARILHARDRRGEIHVIPAIECLEPRLHAMSFAHCEGSANPKIHVEVAGPYKRKH